MLTERLIDLIERYVNFSFSERAIRKISLLIRLLFIFAFTFVVIRLAPTMANELMPTPNEEVAATISDEPSAQPSAQASPDAEASPTPSPAPVPTEEAIEPVPVGSPSPTSSATPPPPTALANQNMQLRVPTSLLVDPRARTASVPDLYVAGPENLLVCISSPAALSDVYLKNVADSEFGTQKLVVGDRSSNLLVTGSLEQILVILNGAQGIRVSSSDSTMANHSVNFRFVATSAPTLDSKLCSKASPANSRTLIFRQLGLALEMKKGDVILKRQGAAQNNG
jgi:hypothetical protein